MRLAEPGERFVMVGGYYPGYTGDAIDYLSREWEFIVRAVRASRGVGLGPGRLMWCAMDSLPARNWGDFPWLFSLEPPPPNAYISPQSLLMRIDPDQSIRDEKHEDAEQTPREAVEG